MKLIMSKLLVLAGVIVVPTILLASTYAYVDVNGQIKNIVAQTADQALTASDIGPHSGVMEINSSSSVVVNTTTTNTFGFSSYQYVSSLGVLKTVIARNSTDALNTAIDIAPTSGVMLVAYNR